MKYEIPAMLASGGGAIVNTASVVGLTGRRETPAYVASKHGIIGLIRLEGDLEALRCLLNICAAPGALEIGNVAA